VNESGRSYAPRYERVQRRKHHAFLEEAIERSGGRVLFSSGPDSAPLFLGVEDASGQRVGICAYVFLANRRETRNRPADEHRLQIRYGDVNDSAWRAGSHPIGFDPLAVDVTIVHTVAHRDLGVLQGRRDRRGEAHWLARMGARQHIRGSSLKPASRARS
jgi:hypothetical protein